jgi:LemA protein
MGLTEASIGVKGGAMFAHGSGRALSLVLACLALLFSPAVGAQSADYLKEMPSPDKVVSGLSGANRRDLSAKQAGAMYQMRNLIWDLAGERVFHNQLTSEETRLTGLYVARYGAITSAESKTFDAKETRELGAQSTRAKWFDARTRYETSPEFRGELLTRFFSPAFRTRLAALDAQKRNSAPAPLLQTQPRSNLPSSQGILASVGRIVEDTMVWLIAFLLLGFLLVIVAFGVRSYNELHRLLEPVKKSRSGIKIAIDRRCTAVNDLVALTQHFANSEQLVYLKVSQDMSGASMAAAYQQSASVLNNVQHIADRYPNLKSNEHFHRIMNNIEACEHEIKQYRHHSNDEVQRYNTCLQQFPRVVIARLTGFGREEYVDLDVSQARAQATAMQLSNDGVRRLDHVLGLPPAPPQQPAQLPQAPPPAQLASGLQQAHQPAMPSLAATSGPAARGGGTSVVQALPQVSLRFVAGPLSGRSIPIGAGAMVGREAPAQVVVPDPQVSSAHAWIGMGSTGLIFVDRGSTNGSIVNGSVVHPGHEVQIKGGDVISLGRTNSVSFVVDQA